MAGGNAELGSRVNKIHTGDCLRFMSRLPEKSVDFCMTSPPYWRLRDYGIPGQIGQEKTPEEYIEKLVAIFRELKRVLKDTGSFYLNLGDTYIGPDCCRVRSWKKPNDVFVFPHPNHVRSLVCISESIHAR